MPSTIALELALFPAILMALAIVREKELGSITNLYVTPVTRFEFLVGKQLPYVAVAMVNFYCPDWVCRVLMDSGQLPPRFLPRCPRPDVRCWH